MPSQFERSCWPFVEEAGWLERAANIPVLLPFAIALDAVGAPLAFIPATKILGISILVTAGGLTWAALWRREPRDHGDV